MRRKKLKFWFIVFLIVAILIIIIGSLLRLGLAAESQVDTSPGYVVGQNTEGESISLYDSQEVIVTTSQSIPITFPSIPIANPESEKLPMEKEHKEN